MDPMHDQFVAYEPILVVFPLKAKKGMAGIDLGLYTPLLVLFLTGCGVLCRRWALNLPSEPQHLSQKQKKHIRHHFSKRFSILQFRLFWYET